MYRALASIERAWTSVLMNRASGSAGVMPCVCEAEGAQWRAHRGRPPAARTKRLWAGDGPSGGGPGEELVCHTSAMSVRHPWGRGHTVHTVCHGRVCVAGVAAPVFRASLVGLRFLIDRTGPHPIQSRIHCHQIRPIRALSARRFAPRGRSSQLAKLIATRTPVRGRAV